jgi:hypothetical protein
MNINERKNYSFNNTFINDNQKRYNGRIIIKRQKKPYGTTALENARKSLEYLRDKKENELYSMLQHKIKSEFMKYKTADKFYKKQRHLDNVKDKLHDKKQSELYERQMMQNERLLTQNELNEYQKKIEKDKIAKYQCLFKKREKNIAFNNLKKIEKMNIKKGEEEMKNEEIKYRLNILSEKDKERRYEIDRIMKEKDEERKIKMARKASEQKFYNDQKNLEKRYEIDSALQLLKNKQMKYNDAYKQKEIKKNEKMEKLNLKKLKEIEEKGFQNMYRLADHEYRYELIKRNYSQKNKDYFDKQKKNEEKIIVLKFKKERKNEERKQMIKENDLNIKNNLMNCEINNNNFKNRVRNKILSREKATEKLLEEKKLKNMRKREEHSELEKEMEYRINETKINDSIYREKKRIKLNERRDKINSFLNERQLISEEKRNINDDFDNQYTFYSRKIDEMMYKKPMNKKVLNDINDMVSNNRKLGGLVQNISA